MKTISAALDAVALRNASRTAVVDGETRADYAELGRRVSALASFLEDRGVRPGHRVALMLPNGLDYVVGFLAIVRAGAIVVPLNDHYQQPEILHFIRTCRVSLWITSREFSELSRGVLDEYGDCEGLFMEEAPRALSPGTPPGSDRGDPSAPVLYQFSSGSTGTPKRIARTHSNLLFELAALSATLGTSNTDRFLGVAPFSHVNGLMRSMLTCLYSGAALYPLPRFERRTAAELIEREALTVFIAVPFMFSMLAKATFRRPPDFSSLRLCISASAPMPTRVNHEFHERFAHHVRQLYGCTEAGTISVNLHPRIEDSLDSVGTPLPGVEVEVLREDGGTIEGGDTGELAVRSPAAITGYQDLEEVNQQVFRDGFFLTGDLGRRGADGLLYLTGRKSFFINKGGFKIDPREIEELLEGHPGVEEVAVIGLSTPLGDEKVKAVIVPRGPCREEEIVEFCRHKIADFKIPSVVEFRDSLPKSPTGKLRRGMLR